MATTPLRALPLDELRQRTSSKWRTYPDTVLPLFVAETDFALAPAITQALAEAVRTGDTGYTASTRRTEQLFAEFVERRFGWQVDRAKVRTTGDVCMGVVEILRQVIAPGDEVIVTPPVYPPFYDVIPEAGGVVRKVPLRDTGSGWELDLAGIDAALEAGARGVLLCNPHNPTGTCHSRESLAELARIARKHGAVVVSDEIHAPLAQPDGGFVPFLAVSDDAREVGFAVWSASKAFNLAGLKCALMVAAADSTFVALRTMPDEVIWRTGQFGAIAAEAAFDDVSDEWLDSLLAALDANRRLLQTLLAEHIPSARYRIPDAGYLAWIDLSDAGLGENPAKVILQEAGVALQFGPVFGDEGRGYVRLNFGTSPEIITEAVLRIAALIGR